MATLSERLQAEIDRANTTTKKTDTTVHDAVGSLIEGYGVGGLEPIEYSWNQIPTLVKNYLDNVTYNPNDYTTSQIANYAPSNADKNNTKPIGVTIETDDGILTRKNYDLSVNKGQTIVYNDIPNEYTSYTVKNNAAIKCVGTLKPTGFLRQIKCESSNVRDLGGWACDGGTVKYGKLFRGGEFKVSDLDIFLNQLGIKHELNLRGASEATSDPTILRDYVGFTCPKNYVWLNISDATTWTEILRCVFDCTTKNIPLYFHCSAGADRTGTVACIIEAILGMSQSDIDKDYELTCFSTGSGNDNLARRRNESEWIGMINAINNLTIGTTFRDKVINWVASLGFTANEINAFRKAMINGTPDIIVIVEEPEPSNLVSVSVALDSDEIYNGIGYKNGYYLSSSGGGESVDDNCVITGLMPYKVKDGTIPKTLYVKGVASDTTSHTRMGFFDSDKTYVAMIQGAMFNTDYFTVTELGAKYYKCEPIMTDADTSKLWSVLANNSKTIPYIRVSIDSASGDNLIISTLPITTEEQYTTIPLTWLNDTTCAYTVGSACTVTANTSYRITEEVDVEYGKTYEFTTLISSSSGTGIRWVGVNDSGVVTETYNNTDLLSGTHTITWTPTSTDTTKLRLRTYTDVGKDITELKVIGVGVNNLFKVDEATLNTRFTSSSTAGQNGVYITGYIDAVPGDEIWVKPAFAYDSVHPYDKVNCYNSTSDTKIGAKVLSDVVTSSNIDFNYSNGVGHFTVPDVSGTTRIKIALRHNEALTAITKDDLADVVITKNEPIS